jgi:hypothetical protein
MSVRSLLLGERGSLTHWPRQATALRSNLKYEIGDQELKPGVG